MQYQSTSCRKSRTCVIAFKKGGRKPSATCRHCGQSAKRDPIWHGALWDSTTEGGKSPDFQIFAAIIESGDYLGSRKEMLQLLKRLANENGYEYCEVRQYSAKLQNYTPVMSGPLAVCGGS